MGFAQAKPICFSGTLVAELARDPGVLSRPSPRKLAHPEGVGVTWAAFPDRREWRLRRNGHGTLDVEEGGADGVGAASLAGRGGNNKR